MGDRWTTVGAVGTGTRTIRVVANHDDGTVYVEARIAAGMLPPVDAWRLAQLLVEAVGSLAADRVAWESVVDELRVVGQILVPLAERDRQDGDGSVVAFPGAHHPHGHDPARDDVHPGCGEVDVDARDPQEEPSCET